jgi:hypothetical protein
LHDSLSSKQIGQRRKILRKAEGAGRIISWESTTRS